MKIWIFARWYGFTVLPVLNITHHFSHGDKPNRKFDGEFRDLKLPLIDSPSLTVYRINRLYNVLKKNLKAAYFLERKTILWYTNGSRKYPGTVAETFAVRMEYIESIGKLVDGS